MLLQDEVGWITTPDAGGAPEVLVTERVIVGIGEGVVVGVDVLVGIARAVCV